MHHKKFVIPVINEIGYYHFLSQEEWFLKILEKIIPCTQGAFVDAGMNIGQTMLKLNAVNSSVQYVGFEPNAACNYYCKKLIEKNNFINYTIYPVGLFDKNEILTLSLDMDIASGASVLPEFRKLKSRYKFHQQVPVFTGDDILFDKKIQIGIIKADVEGAELEVISGMKKIIERDMPVIILEILPYYDSESENGKYRKGRMDTLLTFLKMMDYTFFRIHEQTADVEAFEELATHSDMSQTNFLFLPKQQAATILEKMQEGKSLESKKFY
ncbi:MAG: FkbM family methyltransferase [Chitinophagaceae bacterium]